MNYMFAKTITATLAVGAILALSAALAPASAIVIDSHNGTGDFSPDGTGEADVLLTDGFLLPTFQDLACGSSGGFLCFTKTWFPGSIDDVHSMVLSNFVEEPIGLENTLFEFVINATDTPWTDYHLEFTGGGPFGFGLVDVGRLEGGDVVPGTLGVDIEVEAFPGSLFPHRVWFFFDQPFEPFDFDTMTGPVFIMILSIGAFDPLDPFGPFDPDATVTFTQHPSTGVRVVPEPASLALFGFGLLGLGAMRRRRRTA